MNQPNIKDQERLLSVNSNELTVVSIPGSKNKVKVGWIKPYTLERVTKLILKNESGEEECDPKLMAKLSSLFVLNGVSIFFMHSLYWRYLYYIKGYRFDQLLPVVETAKKKSSYKCLRKSYNIGIRDENDINVDDKRRNRIYPSRTFIGIKAFFGEKHPWALKPLVLFGGLISIPEFTYRFVLSQAKIEIMSIDIPYTDYNSSDSENSVKKQEQSDLVDRLNAESVKRMQERIARQKQNQQEEINFTQFLNQQ